MFGSLVSWVKREVLRLVARDIYNDLCAAAPEGHLPEEYAEQPLLAIEAQSKRRK